MMIPAHEKLRPVASGNVDLALNLADGMSGQP